MGDRARRRTLMMAPVMLHVRDFRIGWDQVPGEGVCFFEGEI